MIISASYKTDIPTFYGEWFIHRLRAGYCKILNPYNRTVLRVSLQPKDVEGFIFWTKNIGPFIKYLPEIQQRGFPFIIQHTINAYPRELEHSVVNAAKSVNHLKQIAETYGSERIVWRYDTIVDSSLTPREFHVETFSHLAKSLEGLTNEVVISFAHFYAKTLKNMKQAAVKSMFTWNDPTVEWKQNLAIELATIAATYNIQLSICSQPQFVASNIIQESRCVDANRLAKIAGTSFKSHLRGNRKECGCFESRDIGDYDTCPHGCVYCYAVQNQTIAKSRYQQHDPLSESLFPLPPDAVELNKNSDQLDLL